jgi:glucose/arabinose dehydrogenase
MCRARLIALLFLVACQRPSSEKPPVAESAPVASKGPYKQAPPKQEPQATEPWSAVVDELQIQAVEPTATVRPGRGLEVTLLFRNTGKKPRRIYLIKGEPFRVMQSTFFLERSDGGPAVEPRPQPHGYVVTEADFHELAPEQTLSFTQTLQIPADLAPGKYSVRWEYRNDLVRWEGGSQTIDGYTKPLFGGKDIPGIWKGKVDDRFNVVVVGKK